MTDDRMNVWLAYWGLGQATVAFAESDLRKVLSWVDHCGQPILLTGQSCRGVGHTVVAHKGGIFHDPMGEGEPELEPYDGYWHVDFIIALTQRAGDNL